MNFTFLLCRLLLFAILNFNFRCDINNQVEARPHHDEVRSSGDSLENVAVLTSDDEHSAVVKAKRRTSIIYLDTTEAVKCKKKKSKTKKKKGKKKKGLKKKNKTRRKNSKKAGSKVKKHHEESLNSNTTEHYKGLSTPTSASWKEIVPESNLSESKLSGESFKKRKPVDIIVHIKVKE